MQQVCRPLILPSGGTVILDASTTITFPSDVTYQPACISGSGPFNTVGSSFIVDYQCPFYASSIPLAFVLGATTVLAWTLTIVLFITPGSFAGAGRMSGWLQRRGISNVVTNRHSIIGSGSRPILQKMAALLVAISLTIATAETIMVAQYQYERGYMNTDVLRVHVADQLKVRAMRVVSFVFLWLAQVQTLIRLFPRHKEKLIIKWIGFLLILLDLIFGSLNAFLTDVVRERPRSFQDAIPALAYLFELALSLLYAAWVVYYVITKRRYAFFHANMPSITIIAILSTISILIPVVFFVADIAQPEVDGWGDYFRWVGAAAASIIVWEWVERIEALEGEEKKDGILGREIYDGDEMLDIMPNDTPRGLNSPNGASKKSTLAIDILGSLFSFQQSFGQPKGKRKRRSEKQRAPQKSHIRWNFANLVSKKPAERDSTDSRSSRSCRDEPRLTAPDIDRTRAASVESTQYVVRYQAATTPPPDLDSPSIGVTYDIGDTAIALRPERHTHNNTTNRAMVPHDLEQGLSAPASATKTSRASQQVLTFATNPFRSRRKSPPIEVKNAMQRSGSHIPPPEPNGRFGIRWALEVLRGGEASDRSRGSSRAIVPLEPTIIPAPPRGHTWSPDIHRHSPFTYPRPMVTLADDAEAAYRNGDGGRISSGLGSSTTTTHVDDQEQLSSTNAVIDPPSAQLSGQAYVGDGSASGTGAVTLVTQCRRSPLKRPPPREVRPGETG